MVDRILGSGCYSWAGRTFPPIFKVYPTDRAALGYELTTLNSGSSTCSQLQADIVRGSNHGPDAAEGPTEGGD